MGSRQVITAVLIIAALVVGLFALVISRRTPKISPTESAAATHLRPIHKIIGTSVEGRNIGSYTYLPAQAGGTGKTHLAFVGGIHGGYEWNSVLLAYALMDYLDAHPEVIPKNLSVTVIPSANPDGVYKVTGKEGRFSETDVSTNKGILASGRFNAREIDLNRNFDCKWKPKSTWQEKTVSAGAKPFSEPEAAAIRNFVSENHPVAVVFWHSQANAVYASACEDGILKGTLDLMNAYARASGYPAVKSFDAYETTGAAEDWLASIGIPSITVELQTHETIELERNLAGVKALFEYYRQEE